MGVQNLWQLLDSTGRPVNMNKGLEGKVLAIDISIWLHQAAKAMRDRQNPHILLLLHRICKLLHFKIKPIFIFDGGVPELKRRTLAERRERRELAASKAKEANNKIRQNYLKMLAIQQLKGETIESLPSSQIQTDENERDLFELPENHLRAQLVMDDDDEQQQEFIENSDFAPIRKSVRRKLTTTDSSNDHYVLPDINKIDDSALDHLPVEMQHDILSEMKESLKRGRNQINKMPQKSDDFSDFQVQKLLKQNAISKKISNLNKTIKRQKFDIPLDSDVRVYAGKLASDSNTQYILVKSSDNNTLAHPTQKSPTSSLALTRHTTNDYSADDLMNRDPVAGLSQRSSATKPITTAIEPKSVPMTSQVVSEESEDEEKPELEDQKKSEIEKEESDESDSNDDDMIEVPLVLQPREPIILPDFVFEETPSQANTSVDSFELIEEEKDESSNSSSAIEDMQTYLSEPENPPSIIENKTNPNEISPKESFDQIQTEIISDTAEQMTKARGHERMTTTLNDTMHEDTQYLLRLFGIPFLVSPTEAEAQCAYLDLTDQCDGVISDDSDVWLFGAKRVYRHFFRQNQLVEYYDATVIGNQLGLDRESMIAIGMIVGSDYTKGIDGAGLMTALEILQEFHGNCIERLEKFRRWWKKAQNSTYKTDSKLLKRLQNLPLFEGFPNRTVYEAYVHPKIDEDQSKFTWAMPQLELIREFIGSKLKWDRQRIDDMILPVIKRMNTKEIQSRIDTFFAPLPFEGSGNQIKRNTRLKAALDLLKKKTREAKDDGGIQVNLSDDDDNDEVVQSDEVVTTKRKRTTKATKLMGDVFTVAQKTRARK